MAPDLPVRDYFSLADAVAADPPNSGYRIWVCDTIKSDGSSGNKFTVMALDGVSSL